MRRLLTCLALLCGGGVLAASPGVSGPGEGALAPPPGRNGVAPHPYTLTPVGVGLTLNPLGAAATVSVRSPAYPPTARLLTTVGLERGLTPVGGLYGSLRYELDGGATQDPAAQNTAAQNTATQSTATYFVQAGVWPFEPHRSGRRAAASGLIGGVQGSSLRQPLRREGRLELGLVSVGAAPLQFDSRGEFAVSEGLADRWGYGLRGWRAGLAGVWGATGAAPSPGLWADGALTGDLGGWPLELSVRGGYRPAWPLPIPSTGAFGVLGGVGTNLRVPARLLVGGGLVDLRRVTVEPRLRVWAETSFGVGADVTVSLDALVEGTRAVSVGATVGYAGGLWTRLNLRVQP